MRRQHAYDATGRLVRSTLKQWETGQSEPAGDTLEHTYAGSLPLQNYDGSSTYGAVWVHAGAAHEYGPLKSPAPDTSSQKDYNTGTKWQPNRRSFQAATAASEGDKRLLYGQGRAMTKDASGSGSSWSTGTVSQPTGLGIVSVESRLEFQGTVTATDMSRVTDMREKDRTGVFGNTFSYAGSYSRVTSEALGRDLNPLGRGDGIAYVGGWLNIGKISPRLPKTLAKSGMGSSINNAPAFRLPSPNECIEEWLQEQGDAICKACWACSCKDFCEGFCNCEEWWSDPVDCERRHFECMDKGVPHCCCCLGMQSGTCKITQEWCAPYQCVKPSFAPSKNCPLGCFMGSPEEINLSPCQMMRQMLRRVIDKLKSLSEDVLQACARTNLSGQTLECFLEGVKMLKDGKARLIACEYDRAGNPQLHSVLGSSATKLDIFNCDYVCRKWGACAGTITDTNAQAQWPGVSSSGPTIYVCCGQFNNQGCNQETTPSCRTAHLLLHEIAHLPDSLGRCSNLNLHDKSDGNNISAISGFLDCICRRDCKGNQFNA